MDAKNPHKANITDIVKSAAQILVTDNLDENLCLSESYKEMFLNCQPIR
jgi:hypothetical protein